ncbi:unnamed protein product [Tilletia laevis]|uniref:HTH CENPB-type domain-containing protein n=1 Tax=Tilletia laevis TaxID=157183 RepID=A0A9N8M9Z3_9BASI|nr:unnamed protein product [Tilletia laevis]CAD6979717.1 unnamed protein product [Tilletia controversa]CAD6986380.1 unnamed protein product [Tilletia controversa]
MPSAPAQSPVVYTKEARALAGVVFANNGFTLEDAARLCDAAETIRRRRSGIPFCSATQHGRQRLSDTDEAAIVDFIIHMEENGFSLCRGDVEHSAMGLIAARLKVDSLPSSLGDEWFHRFIERYSDQLSFQTKETLNRQRTKWLSKANAHHFFSLLQSVLTEFGIKHTDIYSTNEAGVQIGVSAKKFKFAGSSKSREQLVTAKKVCRLAA